MLGGVLLVILLASWSEGSSLLPFGKAYKDQTVTGHQERYIELDNPINLDHEQYQIVGINKRGYLSLRKSSLRFSENDATVSVIKVEDDFPLSKPVDVFFRVTNDTDITYAVDSLIDKTYKTQFHSTQNIITTWIQHGCPNEMDTEKTKHIERRTQCILASDASRSYAMYLNDGDGGCNVANRTVTSNDHEPCNVAGRDCSKEDITPSRRPPMSQKIHQDAPVVVQLQRDPLPAGGLDAMSEFDMFQLSTDQGQCLSLSDTAGFVKSCNDENGLVEQMTVFRLHGSPGNEQIELFGSGQCLDREHCHSSTSNLRSSDCGHCGAIHWDLRSDGTLREDNGANCIYVGTVDSTKTAAVHHSSKGCTTFQVTILGNVVQLKSFAKGDCIGNGVFTSCSSAAVFNIYNLPRNYQLKDINTEYCLDREHCHFSTSNTRLFDCSHCGAIHWSIEYNHVGEDQMKNCINRGPADSAVMKHCSDGWENITCEMSTSVRLSSLHTTTFSPITLTDLPKPNPSLYVEMMTQFPLRAARLYKDERDGYARLEFVHALPTLNTFPVVTNHGVFQVEYWVVTIITKVPHTDTGTPWELFDQLISTPNHAVSNIELRYGAVDVTRRHFDERDGLLSLFFAVEESSTPLPGQILKQIDIALTQQDWWHSSPIVHHKTYNQSYITFAGQSLLYRALYWPKN